VASYLDARHAGGEWLIRVEDLDPPREIPGSAEQIIESLGLLGFDWTESIIRQSDRSAIYQAAVEQLLAGGHAFFCSCSRTEIEAATVASSAAGDELRYPGWCRHGVRAPDRELAIRFRTPPGEITFADALQEVTCIDVASEIGDFVIRRRDGLFAYQLAVVVDDAAQGITHVVRGADLLRSTPRQILLQRALGLPTPKYAHVPLVTDRGGVKLSKSVGAAALDLRYPGRELWRALHFLQQEPPAGLRGAGLDTLWGWATEHWQPQRLRNVGSSRIPEVSD
jgi:glutamyl-Q tRNA(Asp) synthetase